jgi:acyl-CoA thioester hydrolase
MDIAFHTPLSASEQEAFGIPAPAPFAMADQVRFSELDVLNHVNNAVYMSWFERVRVKYTQARGLSRAFGSGASGGPRIVIRSGTVHYREEMRMDENYVVTCRCTAFRTTSFSLRQEIWAEGRLRATLDCVLVLLQPDGAGRYPIPDAVRAGFIEVDGATADDAPTPG